jgi:hypothetical protein
MPEEYPLKFLSEMVYLISGGNIEPVQTVPYPKPNKYDVERRQIQDRLLGKKNMRQRKLSIKKESPDAIKRSQEARYILREMEAKSQKPTGKKKQPAKEPRQIFDKDYQIQCAGSL